MVGDRRKRSDASIIPPRKVNVQKFTESHYSALETFHSIISDRLNDDFRSRRNMRRRTTAYDNLVKKKRRKRKKLVDFEKVKERVPPRCLHRRVELRKNPESVFSTSGDGTKGMKTHVWHAKSFAMTKLWGFHLPLGL
ncbi:hypothetical protein JCGZ_14965 [Jatropha curcas]|uniref:Uncharacterized protein n=1 Tax=Jatropha curcas TaxID=180498 RepID=A0A067KIJ7_JATCU|nr:hypothetical protein JCGZ_14965 [Jatropha curcas]